MNSKDFKFDDDAFKDVLSSSDKDEFEDVFSDERKNKKEAKNTAKKTDSGFEDVYSGRDKNEDEYSKFADEYFSGGNTASGGNEDGQTEAADNAPVSQNRRPVNSNVEKKPYSYNYSKASREKARRVSKDNICDDIGEDISSGRQPREKKPKKHHSPGKIILVVIAVLLAIIIALGATGYFYAKSLTTKVDYSPLDANKYISSSELMRKDGVMNILLVGVDARETEDTDSSRSDTMIMLTIDNNNKQIKLTSFLRDTYIEIPGYKWAKLNAAQSHGGTQLLIDTLETNYKVDINNYMLVNFDMFQTIIDTLGGIDVDVTEKEAKYINSKDHMTDDEAAAFPTDISAGNVHFTGAQALWYSRIRYLDSDFYRTQRQRKVITAIVSKAKKTDPVTLIKMINEIIPMVETDLSSDDLMKLGMNSPKYLKYDMAQQQIPADDTWSSGKRNSQSVLIIDLAKNQSILKSFVFDKAQITTSEATTSSK